MNKLSLKFIALSLIIALNGSAILAIGETLAYFNDTEESLTNSIVTGTLDFSLSPGTFQLTPGESNKMVKTLSVVNEGSLGFQYSIHIDNIQGNLCNDLLIKGDNLETTGTDCATSSLNLFNCTGNQITNPLDNWKFTIIRTDETNTGTCDFDIVFDGKQIDCLGGFSDTEKISNSIDFSNAQTGSSLVINEVYYDVDENNYGTEAKNEWIELYNNSSQTVNLKNWSLTDNSGYPEVINQVYHLSPGEFVVISHDNGTCANYWGCDTTKHINLGGNMSPGWLDNDGDELTLKDNLGNIIDFVAWEGYYTGWDMNAQEGESIARKTAGLDTDTPSDWTVLTSPNPGTNPGHESLPNIVLNEFLPNPSSFPYEYVELYNLDSQAYDLSGYYLETNTGIIPINSITTAQYGLGSTTIVDEGWLAITTLTNNDLDNVSDTLTLYTDTGEILDIISYPLDGEGTSSIPEDKSIARIPDGTGGWVDPYPTPGGPNIIKDNQKLEIENQEQTTTTEINPLAIDVYVNTPISTLVDILLKGEPEDVEFVITSGVSHGELSSLEGATVTYTPEEEFKGKDQFTFQAYIGQKHSENAWVYITIGEELNQQEDTEEVSTTTNNTVENTSDTANTENTGSTGGSETLEETEIVNSSTTEATSTETKATSTEIIEDTATTTATTTTTTTATTTATTTESVENNTIATTTAATTTIDTDIEASSTEDIIDVEATTTEDSIINDQPIEEEETEELEEPADTEEEKTDSDTAILEEESNDNSDSSNEDEAGNEDDNTTESNSEINNIEETQENEE